MPRKILHELRIRRSRDGGHEIEHRHDEAHDPELHRFRRSGQAVQHVLSQIDKLEPKGLPHPELEEQEASEPQPWAGGRSADFDDSDSRGSGQVSGRRR